MMAKEGVGIFQDMGQKGAGYFFALLSPEVIVVGAFPSDFEGVLTKCSAQSVPANRSQYHLPWYFHK